MRIILNGEPFECPEDTTVAALIEVRGLVPEQVAVEVNEALVPKAARRDVVLHESDAVELVTLVGGG